MDFKKFIPTTLLSKVKIRDKILFLTVIGIIVSIGFSTLTVINGKNQIAALENIYVQKVMPLNKLRQIQLLFREIEGRMTGVAADMVSGTAAANHLKISVKEINHLWGSVKGELTSDSLSDAKNRFESGYSSFKGNVDSLDKAYIIMFQDGSANGIEDIYDKWLDYKPLIIKSIDEMVTAQDESAKEYYISKKKLTAKINASVITVSIVVIGLFIITAFIIIRSILDPIKTVVASAKQVAQGDLTHTIQLESNDEMGIMAAELNSMFSKLNNTFIKITDESENIFGNVEGLKAIADALVEGTRSINVDQVVASSAQMSSTIVEIAKNAADASNITKESFTSAQHGSDVSNETKESIAKLVNSVHEASVAISGLDKSSDEIGEIVSVIKDIADQTNLLALNAAIEAARAGEHGRGFAVVADEVKKLAERTSKSTEEIARKIQSNQKETKAVILSMQSGESLANEAITKVADTGEALQAILASSEHVMDTVLRIASATEEQSAAAEEVSQTMEHAADSINQTFILADNIKNVSGALFSVANELKTQVEDFHTMAVSTTVEKKTLTDDDPNELPAV